MWILIKQKKEDYEETLLNVETGHEIRLSEKSNSVVFVKFGVGPNGVIGAEQTIAQFDNKELLYNFFKNLALVLKARDAASPGLDLVGE